MIEKYLYRRSRRVVLLFDAGLLLFLYTARHPKSGLTRAVGLVMSGFIKNPNIDVLHGREAIQFCLIFLPVFGFACLLLSIFLRTLYKDCFGNAEVAVAVCQDCLVTAPYCYMFKTAALYYTSSAGKALRVGNALSPPWLFFALTCEAAIAYALIEVMEKAALRTLCKKKT